MLIPVPQGRLKAFYVVELKVFSQTEKRHLDWLVVLQVQLLVLDDLQETFSEDVIEDPVPDVSKQTVSSMLVNWMQRSVLKIKNFEIISVFLRAF